MPRDSTEISTLHRMRLYADTCIRLPKMQLAQRVLHHLWTPAVPARPSASMRALSGMVPPVLRPRTWTEDGTFMFLNQRGCCDNASKWQDRSHGLLWTYNLHYFFDLLAADAPARKAEHLSLMARWDAENPPASGVGWTPYPCSLRISNWIKWHYWVGSLTNALTQSLAQQAAWQYRRCEYHHRGNHLFVNAKALCMAGLAIDSPESARWLDRGMAILSRELPDQVLADGGHCERSPMYHALILEDVLDMLSLANASSLAQGADLRQLLSPHVAPMLDWLRSMCHPDGGISFFNDAANGIAPTLGDLEPYAARVMGDPCLKDPPPRSVHLRDSGFVRTSRGPWTVIADIGPVGAPEQPAHAHADSLSFEASFGSQRVFVNSGVSTYAAGPERIFERGTAAHNCVEVDRRDSSEVWSSFRVARRAEVSVELVSLDDSTARIVASHDGYSRLEGKPVLHREISLSSDALVIADSLSSTHLPAVARLHLHPDVRAECGRGATNQALLYLPDGTRLILTHSAAHAEIVPGFWRPEFGRKVPNVHLKIDVPDGGLVVRVCESGTQTESARESRA